MVNHSHQYLKLFEERYVGRYGFEKIWNESLGVCSIKLVNSNINYVLMLSNILNINEFSIQQILARMKTGVGLMILSDCVCYLINLLVY